MLHRYSSLVPFCGIAIRAWAATADLCSMVSSGFCSSLRWPDFSPIRTAVAEFYEPSSYAPPWIHRGSPTPQALALIRVLQNSAVSGLDPEDYDGSRWGSRLVRFSGERSADVLEFDLALTISAMRYLSDSTVGRVNPALLCFGLDVEEKKCDLPATLLGLVNSNDVERSLEQIEPPFAEYRRTQQALKTYLDLAREDDGEKLLAGKKPIEPGMHIPA